MRRIYLGTFVAAWMSQLLTPVFALNDTIGVTAGSGKTANLIKFGSNNVISEVGICDATTENQCVAVSAGGALSAAVTGSVTANAGTNLNTSLLALEGGGNLATLAGAISTARMQTNASQIAGTTTATGNGLVGAGVQRVAIASDNSAVPITGTVSGAVTANAGTNLNTSALALETGGNLATLAGAITSTRMQANVSQINGVTPLMGNGGTGTGSQRVTVASDNTPFTVNVAQATSSSLKGQVDPLTAASWALGAFAANMPANGVGIGLYDSGSGHMVRTPGDETLGVKVQITAGGGTGGIATPDGTAWVVGTTSFTPVGGQYTMGGATACVSTKECTVGMTSAREFMVSDAALLAAAQAGTGLTGAAVPASGIYTGANALSAEPAATMTGDLTGFFVDLAGKTVTSPYANRESMLRCAVTITTSTSPTTCTGMGAQGSGVKIYVTDFTCTRSDGGTTAAQATLNDSATTIVDMPNNGGGGGYAHTYNVPLVVAANTAFQITTASLTSVHCSAAGFKGY